MIKLSALVIGLLSVILLNYSLAAGNTNVIFGCYQKNNGQLRIVKQSSLCQPSEVPISWNTAGQAGPAGPTGPSGPQGAAGPPGVSVEITSLPQNDPHCPNSGIQFTSASSVAYACNGGGTEGGTITIRRMETQECIDGYGFCPNIYAYVSYFRIRDEAVNDRSVIAINLFQPGVNPYLGCEVNSIGTGEFSIVCDGWSRVDKGAILNYAIFNP